MRYVLLVLIWLCLPVSAVADDRLVRVFVPDSLAQSGLPKHILPRFSLKTQIRTEIVPRVDAADIAFGETGKPLFEGLGRTWHIDVRRGDHSGTQRFVKWLQSDVGQRTIRGFAPEGETLFGAPSVKRKVAKVVVVDADAEFGHKVSRKKCTRCHAVDAATRGFGIGSAPSFAVLRSLGDWESRFAAFYVLKPHPAFTQITDVTDPFPPERPSPIVPIELSVDELNAVLAYVTTMKAADLGKPLDHQ